MPFIGRGGSSPPSDTTQWECSHPPPSAEVTLEAGTDMVPAAPLRASLRGPAAHPVRPVGRPVGSRYRRESVVGMLRMDMGPGSYPDED